MLQTVIALTLVAIASIYTAWRFLPPTLCNRLVHMLASMALRLRLINLHQAQRLVAMLIRSDGGCSQCDSCPMRKGCSTPQKGPR